MTKLFRKLLHLVPKEEAHNSKFYCPTVGFTTCEESNAFPRNSIWYSSDGCQRLLDNKTTPPYQRSLERKGSSSLRKKVKSEAPDVKRSTLRRQVRSTVVKAPLRPRTTTEGEVTYVNLNQVSPRTDAGRRLGQTGVLKMNPDAYEDQVHSGKIQRRHLPKEEKAEVNLPDICKVGRTPTVSKTSNANLVQSFSAVGLLPDADVAFKVVFNLRTRLRALYDSPQHRKVPAYARRTVLLSEAFSAFLQMPQNATGGPRFCEAFVKSLKSGARIVVVGPPGFGKSTLVSTIVRSSLNPNRSINIFDLCLFVRCSELQLDHHRSVSESLVDYCTEMISDRGYNRTLVFNVLLKFSHRTLIILEDYDECGKNRQEIIRDFVKNTTFFEKSAIIVTTRPLQDAKFMSIFHRTVKLHGFSKVSFRSLLGPEIYDRVLNSFPSTHHEHRLNYLSEMSPFFTRLTQLAVLRDEFLTSIQHSSLYQFVDYVMASTFVNQECMFFNINNSYGYEKCFLSVGKLFLQAMMNRCFRFTEDLLGRMLGKRFDLIVNYQIVYKVRDSSEKVWSASNRFWMIFFATKYVRHLWSQCKTDEQRQRFMTKVLCFDRCQGEYVVGHSGRVYYVGFIPEILLDFGYQTSLEKATVEMLYDAEDTANSHAFDSVNLLQRVHEHYLLTYNFELQAGDDETARDIFKDILPASDLGAPATIEYYYNTYEERYFARLFFKDENDNNLLCTVFRANEDCKLERIKIVFPVFKLKTVFSSVRDVLQKVFPSLDWKDFKPNESGIEIVYRLVGSIAECGGRKSAIVIWQDQCEHEISSWKSTWCFRIVPEAESADSRIRFTRQNFLEKKPLDDSNYTDCYNVKEFCDQRTDVLRKIVICVHGAKSPNLSIDILRER